MENSTALEARLAHNDILLTGPLIGEPNLAAANIENTIVAQHDAFAPLMKQEKMKAAMVAMNGYYSYLEGLRTGLDAVPFARVTM